MKVPNRVLNAVRSMAKNEPVTEEDKTVALKWALEGIAKRTAPAATPTTQEA